MEAKKTSWADLESKKNIFLKIGLTVALAVVFTVFEWKTAANEAPDFTMPVSEVEYEVIVPITISSPQLPPPPQLRPLTDWIDIVEEEDLLTNELDISDIKTTTIGATNEPVTLEQLGSIGTQSDELESAVLVLSEDMPFFPNVRQWIGKHTKYIALNNGIYGKVYVQFIVEKNGSISNVKVIKSVDALLDKEAIRIIESMPKWTPGKQRGKAVRVSYTMPINFQLSGYNT